ncbi:unnamed protein product [Closterium sp. Yama58-4]|nr:unnamed protein product [Closterium sp. Yama58-4]
MMASHEVTGRDQIGSAPNPVLGGLGQSTTRPLQFPRDPESDESPDDSATSSPSSSACDHAAAGRDCDPGSGRGGGVGDMVEASLATFGVTSVLRFRNLSHSVASRRIGVRSISSRRILVDISGSAKSGQITAIMGASGAGKTTLLNILACRIASGRRAGEVELDGLPVRSGTMRRVSAYVMQDDLMFPSLTVRETMMFAAELRLPQSVRREEKVARVARLLELLGLTEVAETKIGDEGQRGVSGGERKRVAIGTEIICDPKILFLDEPTSGLDSTSAFRVVRAIKDIATNTNSIAVMVLHQVRPSSWCCTRYDLPHGAAPGATFLMVLHQVRPSSWCCTRYDLPHGAAPGATFLMVLHQVRPRFLFHVLGTTITFIPTLSPSLPHIPLPIPHSPHLSFPPTNPPFFSPSQPSFRVLGLVDRLILLASGHAVFQGAPPTLPRFLESVGFPVPQFANSTEFALDLIEDMQRSSRGVADLVHFAREYEREQEEEEERERKLGKLGEQAVLRRNPQSKGVLQLAVLTRRNALITFRTPALYLLRLGLIAITGIMLATIFFQPNDSMKGFQERLAFFSFAICVLFFVSCDAVPIFIQERNIFLRETSSSAYRPSTYLLSSTLVYLPLHLLMALTLVLEAWWCLGLQGGPEGFCFMVLACFAMLFTGNAIATCVSICVNHVVLAYAVAIALMAYFALLSGFYIDRESIPDGWVWLHYFSPMKYAYEALAINEFGRPGGPCYLEAGTMFDNTPVAPYLNATRINKAMIGMRQVLAGTPYSKITISTCLRDGPQLLTTTLAVNQLDMWENVAVLLGFGVFVRFVTFLLLVRFSKAKHQ